MTIRKTRNSSIALKPLYALGFALILMGCSNSETDTEHHDDHHHTEHEPSKTHSGKTLKTPDDKTTDDNHSTIRSAESHVHGGAKLAIVSEGNNVTIEFETPIYNLLGFEYAPQTPTEKTRVIEAEKALSSPKNLIKFNRHAKCAFQTPTSKVELFDDHADEDGHDEAHDEDHNEHDDEHKEAGSHKDVILNYSLSCESIDKIKSVRVEFFNVFSSFTELELVYLGPSQQMSAKLSPSRPNVDLIQ